MGVGEGVREPREPLGTDLGLAFDAPTSCPGLSCACHAQWKESKPQDTKEDFIAGNRQRARQSLQSYLPDLTGGQWQYVMGFLGVERAAPGGELILCTSHQPK